MYKRQAQARAALQNADVLCGYTVYIDLVRPLFPEKEVYATGMTREIDRCQMCIRDRSGNVWCTAQSLFQQSMELPDLILDMNRVFTEGTPNADELKFLTKLQ